MTKVIRRVSLALLGSALLGVSLPAMPAQAEPAGDYWVCYYKMRGGSYTMSESQKKNYDCYDGNIHVQRTYDSSLIRILDGECAAIAYNRDHKSRDWIWKNCKD